MKAYLNSISVTIVHDKETVGVEDKSACGIGAVHLQEKTSYSCNLWWKWC